MSSRIIANFRKDTGLSPLRQFWLPGPYTCEAITSFLENFSFIRRTKGHELIVNLDFGKDDDTACPKRLSLEKE